jgi:hypothetical protein
VHDAIVFEPVNPCPKSRGVALMDIMEMTEVAMLGADQKVMGHLLSRFRSIDLLLEVSNSCHWMLPVFIYLA